MHLSCYVSFFEHTSSSEPMRADKWACALGRCISHFLLPQSRSDVYTAPAAAPKCRNQEVTINYFQQLLLLIFKVYYLKIEVYSTEQFKTVFIFFINYEQTTIDDHILHLEGARRHRSASLSIGDTGALHDQIKHGLDQLCDALWI